MPSRHCRVGRGGHMIVLPIHSGSSPTVLSSHLFTTSHFIASSYKMVNILLLLVVEERLA
jgi:hypothetical protein